MKIVSIHQPQYFPWLGLVDKISKSDVFVILDNVEYSKNSFQSRAQVRNKDGYEWMTVPVNISGKSKQLLNEVAICNKSNWSRKHLNKIRMNYSGTPYFNNYFPEISKILEKKWSLLYELNVESLTFILECFNIDVELVMASELNNVYGNKNELLISICKELNADTYLSGNGAKSYMDIDMFKREGIMVEWQDFKHPVYEQKWDCFIKGMSAIDVLFNHGGKSKELLLMEREDVSEKDISDNWD